ncbi:DUF3618 domain-containing protein [Streptomyces sp. NBC_00435]|uniref:DUF3618 domain-containing protein n=1 Tax=Streptomyces sp. NBC_00435 TaxID=2903649 RepID=UPI002E1E8432
MTTTKSHGTASVRTAQEVRRQFARTRDELGRTVGALAGRAGVAGRAHDGIAAVRGQVGQVTGRLRGTARHTVRGRAGRAAATARSNGTALIAAGGALAGILLLRRTRRARRGTPRGH